MLKKLQTIFVLIWFSAILGHASVVDEKVHSEHSQLNALEDPESKWIFTNSTTNVTCVIIQFSATINVTYGINGSTNTTTEAIKIPSDAKVISGQCGEKEQMITLEWDNVINVNLTLNNNMTLQFEKNITDSKYWLKFINVSLAMSDSVFPNISRNGSASFWTNSSEWTVSVGSSYRCNAPRVYNLTGAFPSVKSAKLTLVHVQEEAFHTTKGGRFSSAIDCEGGNDVPDAVPIAVGAALAILILFVLVAYLLARRRSHTRGYLSM